MARIATVADVRGLEQRWAAEHNVPLEQVRAEVHAKWEIVAFLGVWSSPANEVIVPNGCPIGWPLHAIIIS